MEELSRSCGLGKAHKLLFMGKLELTTDFECVVLSDIVESLMQFFPDRSQYASGFIYEQSRYALVGFMVHRNELAPVYLAPAEKLQQLGGVFCELVIRQHRRVHQFTAGHFPWFSRTFFLTSVHSGTECNS